MQGLNFLHIKAARSQTKFAKNFQILATLATLATLAISSLTAYF
jgi:hypothetical protein